MEQGTSAQFPESRQPATVGGIPRVVRCVLDAAARAKKVEPGPAPRDLFHFAPRAGTAMAVRATRPVSIAAAWTGSVLLGQRESNRPREECIQTHHNKTSGAAPEHLQKHRTGPRTCRAPTPLRSRPQGIFDNSLIKRAPCAPRIASCYLLHTRPRG